MRGAAAAGREALGLGSRVSEEAGLVAAAAREGDAMAGAIWLEAEREREMRLSRVESGGKSVGNLGEIESREEREGGMGRGDAHAESKVETTTLPVPAADLTGVRIASAVDFVDVEGINH